MNTLSNEKSSKSDTLVSLIMSDEITEVIGK